MYEPPARHYSSDAVTLRPNELAII